MEYTTLGRSGLIVSRLALGTMLFGEGAARSTPRAEALELLDAYLGAGGNHVDTADVYADGRSEEIVGEGLASRRHDVVLATKVRFRTGGGANDEGLSRRHIIAGVEASLRRLRTDYIDLLYVHCYDPLTPLEETIRALDDVVRAGKVRYLGISNFKAWQLMRAQALADALGAHRFIAAQYQYSLVEREIEREFVDLCASEGLGLVPWGPLGGGFLTGKYTRGGAGAGRIADTPAEAEEYWERRATERNWATVECVREIADRLDAEPSQVALAWLLRRPQVDSVILGARTLAQLHDNLAAARLAVPADDLASLTRVSALPEAYPYRMIEVYGGREPGPNAG